MKVALCLILVALALVAEGQFVGRPQGFAPPVSGQRRAITNQMAFNLLGSTASTGNQNHYSTDAMCAPHANALVLCAVVSSAATEPDFPQLSGCGLNWKRWLSTNFNTRATPTEKLSLFIAQGDQPFQDFVVFTCNTGVTNNQTGCAMCVVELTGASISAFTGSNAVVQMVVNSSDASANPTITLATLESNTNAVVAFFGNSLNPFGGTPEGSWTEDLDTGYATPNTGIYCTHRLGTTDNTVGPTVSSSAWAGVALEIRAGHNLEVRPSTPVNNYTLDYWQTFNFAGQVTTGLLDGSDNCATGSYTVTDPGPVLFGTFSAWPYLMVTHNKFNGAFDNFPNGMSYACTIAGNGSIWDYTAGAAHNNWSWGFWFQLPMEMTNQAITGEFDLMSARDNAQNQDFYIKATKDDAQSIKLYFFHPAVSGTWGYITNIAISAATPYLFTGKGIMSDKFYMSLYDKDGILVHGEITSTIAGTNTYRWDTPWQDVRIGPISGGSQASTNGLLLFDNVMLDWTSAVYPLGL